LTTETQNQSPNSNPNHHSTHQPHFKNQYPLLFVHPFLPFPPHNQFTLPPKYSPPTKYNIHTNLTNHAYNLHQPNIPPFTTNYHPPLQLYYYLKPPPLHYPSPHPPKYP
ncbi:lipase-like domain-containing protein, partial [Staphylococcus epidermidis]